MLTVCTFLWRDPKYRWNGKFLYKSGHVNKLAASVRRNLQIEHEFVCVTDMPDGIDSSIRVVPLWNDYREMGGCYLRLKLFSPEMRDVLGERFVQIDVDSVVTGDLTPLLKRPEKFIAWKNINWPKTPYSGSMFMMTAGSRPLVWSSFDRKRSPQLTAEQKMCGTDQAWIGYVLGKREATWSEADGVYSYAFGEKSIKRAGTPPRNARIVFFNGPYDPGMKGVRHNKWIVDNWRK